MKSNKVLSTLVVTSLLMSVPCFSYGDKIEEIDIIEITAPAKKSKMSKSKKSTCETTKTPSKKTKDKIDKKDKPKSKTSKKDKQTDQKAKNAPAEKSMHEKTGKDMMHTIEKELDEIRKNFKTDSNVQTANKKLKKIPAKIKKAVAQLQKDELHGTMWKRHQHKLEEKLAEVRHMVDGKKNA